MEEQRAFERFDLKVPAKIGIKKNGQKEKEISSQTSNICAGGAFFKTEEPLPEGTKVEIDLVLSIDCQHISYHHFLRGYPSGAPLVLDLASPPGSGAGSRAQHGFPGERY